MANSTDWQATTIVSTTWGAGNAFSNNALLLQDNSSSLLLQNGVYALGLESSPIG